MSLAALVHDGQKLAGGQQPAPGRKRPLRRFLSMFGVAGGEGTKKGIKRIQITAEAENEEEYFNVKIKTCEDVSSGR